jgi:GNAT superfamily N-acetyltransferase
MNAATAPVQEVDRAAIQRWLPCLQRWLLGDAFYGVHHTWPQLYRSDGAGRFFVLADGDRLLSHCATRVVTVHGTAGPFAACLLGSVVTAPELRGNGLASQVLAAALRANAPGVSHTLLWAERPELYARAGFVAGASERCLVLARRPRRTHDDVRPAEVRDHAALHALHERKPLRVARSVRTMSGLLTTPGMRVFVLERGGAVVAYACTGKGADLQGYWHELGGSDDDLALLLPAVLHAAEQTEAYLLLPPYRPRLAELLAPHVTGEADVPGPLWRGDTPLPACWFDGLDSV